PARSAPRLRQGNPVTTPGTVPYCPSDGSATVVQLSPLVPCTQSRIWSTAAPAAEAADDDPRTEMISAPRFATRGMNVSANHSSSSPEVTSSPRRVRYDTSGNWVAESL